MLFGTGSVAFMACGHHSRSSGAAGWSVICGVDRFFVLVCWAQLFQFVPDLVSLNPFSQVVLCSLDHVISK